MDKRKPDATDCVRMREPDALCVMSAFALYADDVFVLDNGNAFVDANQSLWRDEQLKRFVPDCIGVICQIVDLFCTVSFRAAGGKYVLYHVE